MKKQLPILLLLAILPAAKAETHISYPREVAVFIEHAKDCAHFAGEFDPDLPQKEQRRIAAETQAACSTANKQYPKLIRTYRSNARISKVLRQYAHITDYY
ncbi:hypothetical protein [Neisseria wadsworthii]|uniref:Secreted protein n=1 Tax=Neisseria wadsworthii 9715 TaxID=1030841 RepID=G4CNW8_9NEIS|nr:hypothetical protein [Neisseria wadsworthii]EGZ48918.1 hypothetical protein HMPREF9370_0777 [Neisseria wadsworthii 9715]QMT34628.1 hypothetical protein H3L96_05865 [Neisseria wadsworthii]